MYKQSLKVTCNSTGHIGYVKTNENGTNKKVSN